MFYRHYREKRRAASVAPASKSGSIPSGRISFRVVVLSGRSIPFPIVLTCFSLFVSFPFPPQLCVILEPMQELMSRHKAYALSPRDCLKTTLFQKWQRMVAPPGKLCWTTDDRKVLKEPNRIPDAQRPANKRRKRKGSSSGAGAGNAGPPAPSKKRSPGPNFSLASQVVSRICVFFTF